MVNGKKVRSLVIYIFIFLIALFFIRLITNIYTPPNKGTLLLKDNWHLIFNNKKLKKEFTVPFIAELKAKKESDLKDISFITTVNIEDKNRFDFFVISDVAVNAFEVYINGHLIGQIGDFAGGNSNIWGHVFLFSVKEFLKNGENRIVLKVKALYLLEFDFPPFLATYPTAKNYVFLKSFLNNLVTFIGIGFMFFSFIFLIILGEDRKIAISFDTKVLGFSFLFMAIYFLDYITFYILPVRYIFFKKFVLVSIHFSFFLLLAGLLIYLRRKIDLFAKFLLIIGALEILVMLFSKNDMIPFRNIYSATNIFLVAVIFYLLIKLGIHRNKDRYTKILFYAIFFSSIFIFYDVYIIFSGKPGVLFSRYGALFFFLAIILIIALRYKETSKEAILEKERANLFFEVSRKDALTGAFNRNVIEEIDELLSDNYSLLMFDVDNFKEINDKYGHLVGDEILKRFVDIIRKYVRKTDVIIRYGGDEFFVILINCTYEVAEKIAKKIENELKESPYFFENQKIFFSASVGIVQAKRGEAILKVLEKADENMYLAKQKRKENK